MIALNHTNAATVGHNVSLHVSMPIPSGAVAALMQRSQEKLRNTLRQIGIDDSSVSMIVEHPFTELKIKVSIFEKGATLVQKAVQDAMDIVIAEFGLQKIGATVTIGERNI